MHNRINTFVFGMLAAVSFVLLFPAAPLRAVQIPLDGASPVTGGGKTGPSDKIAFVDIEVLFNEHPMKKRLQDEFLAAANNRKKGIADQEKSIRDLDTVIASSMTEVARAKAELEAQQQPAAPAQSPAAPQRMLLPGTTEAVTVPPPAAQPAPAPVVQSTATAASPERLKEIQDKEAGIEAMRKELQKRKDDLAARVKQDKADLVSLEQNQSEQVMADLYRLLDKIAKEENLTIILNKNDVLYGQSYQDKTQEVLKRLQGR